MATSKKPLSSRITIRLTKEEASRVSEDAAGETLSTYVRMRLFGEKAYNGKCSLSREGEVKLAQILAKLGQSRLSSNLNQLAKAVNIGALPVTPETENEIASACAAVNTMRRELLQALGLSVERT